MAALFVRVVLTLSLVSGSLGGMNARAAGSGALAQVPVAPPGIDRAQVRQWEVELHGSLRRELVRELQASVRVFRLDDAARTPVRVAGKRAAGMGREMAVCGSAAAVAGGSAPGTR